MEMNPDKYLSTDQHKRDFSVTNTVHTVSPLSLYCGIWLRPCASKAFTTTTSSDSSHRNVNYVCVTLPELPLSTPLLFDYGHHPSPPLLSGMSGMFWS